MAPAGASPMSAVLHLDAPKSAEEEEEDELSLGHMRDVSDEDEPVETKRNETMITEDEGKDM